MPEFATMRLAPAPNYTAPDGTDVRLLCGLDGGGLAHFELAPGKTSQAVAHRSVEEIWYCLGGHGEMWRRLGDAEAVVPVDAGVCLTIPVGTHFQFRAAGHAPLSFVAVTMPPWPGEGEAYPVPGIWEPSVAAGKGAA